MKNTAKYSLPQRTGFTLAGRLGSLFFKGLIASSRLNDVNCGRIADMLRDGRKIIIASWHGNVLGGLGIMRKHHGVKVGVMTSQSKDGEYLAAFQRAMNCVPFRGSSTRGGIGAQKGMIRFLKEGGQMLANSVDGPRGPMHEAKAGTVSLAQLTGAALVPTAWASNRAWVFENSWDKMSVPKPFARITAVYANPIEVPRRLEADQKEEYRLLLQQGLTWAQGKAERMIAGA